MCEVPVGYVVVKIQGSLEIVRTPRENHAAHFQAGESFRTQEPSDMNLSHDQPAARLTGRIPGIWAVCAVTDAKGWR